MASSLCAHFAPLAARHVLGCGSHVPPHAARFDSHLSLSMCPVLFPPWMLIPVHPPPPLPSNPCHRLLIIIFHPSSLLCTPLPPPSVHPLHHSPPLLFPRSEMCFSMTDYIPLRSQKIFAVCVRKPGEVLFGLNVCRRNLRAKSLFLLTSALT